MEHDTCFETLEQELAGLPGKYSEPEGALLLATLNGEPAGCVALERIDSERCEMARLWVREQHRGKNVGIGLIEALFEKARAGGYEKMILRTLPHRMERAVSIYKRIGFREIANFEGDSEKILTMELAL